MVSRTPKPMMTRRSASDLKNRRPKRNISPKNLDDSVSGLSWKEERELKKALYASLQDSRRQSRDDNEDSVASCSRDGLSQSQSRGSLCSMTPSEATRYQDDSSTDSRMSYLEKKDTAKTETKKTNYHAQRKFAANTFAPIRPEPSCSDLRVTRLVNLTHQKKIHAQRKFAQGSTPSTPVETPSKPKLKVSPIKLFPGTPKTEDFLTYLCFRGTSLLPPYLDLMNTNKDEMEPEMFNGRPGFTRDSSPASSSSMSHQNEDSMDLPDGQMTPNRKAARASASTPETARGFANLRRRAQGSASTFSPGSRKRLADAYSATGKLKCKGAIKGHLGDRLSLKRKAMATLTAAKRLSPKKQDGVRKFRTSVSDGELVKKQTTLPEEDENNNSRMWWSFPSSFTPKLTIADFETGSMNELSRITSKCNTASGQPKSVTGSVTEIEDSGIHVSFCETYAPAYQDDSHSQKSLANESEAYIDLVKSDKEDPDYISCTALLKPLDSELDDSVDIYPDTDFSLNESLDMNDILSSAEHCVGFMSPEIKKMKLLEQKKVIWINETNNLFRTSFSLLPKQISGLNNNEIYSDFTKTGHKQLSESSLQSQLNTLSDHTYSKTETPVKFALKSCSTCVHTPAKLDLDLSTSQTPEPVSTSTPFLREEDSTREISHVCELLPERQGKHAMLTRLRSKRKLKLVIPTDEKMLSPKGDNLLKTSETRKRKSGNDHPYHKPSPPKKSKVRTNGKMKTALKFRSKEIGEKAKARKAYLEQIEAHPKKLLSTAAKSKKTFKPHRPVTRATTHLKQVIKAAKKAANKKIKLVGKVFPKKYKLGKAVGNKKKIEKKKMSLESVASKSSVASYGSDNSGEIRIKTECFPEADDAAAVVQCPTYYPSDEQFRDPILYIQSIQSEAEQYGMCKIVPPCSWKMESREMEDFRFTTQIQYIHKMWKKWSPITEQLEYIKRLHNDAGNEEFQVPQIGGVELDLVKLYELVQKYGGMKGTAGKEKKWLKIAESMKIPKQADRISKLYAAYCKYLLSYETLSEEETEKLQDKVKQDRKKLEAERQSEVPDFYKCVHKGKSQPLSAFHRAARNTQLLYDPDASSGSEEIEKAYWEIVKKADDHVSVQGASLDTSIYGSMFPVRRDSPYTRHGWNLHNFVESKGSILHHLGLIAGITVPTLHIGMLYTTKCLSCNGHNLPTVQYLHQGPGLVWYAVPSQETDKLRRALKKVAPKSVRDEGFCVQSDSLMVPPSVLVDKGVSLSRCVQSEREFIVIFPSANYSNISLGYTLSESVHYGTQDWIPEGYQASKNLEINQDIQLFSMDAMLVFLARDISTQDTTLALLLPYLEKVVDREITERKKLMEAGLKETERLHDKLEKPSPRCDVLEEIVICDVSNKICYISMVLNSHENSAFSLEQGLLHVQKKKNLKHCKLMFRYSEDELRSLVKEVKSRLRGGNSTPPSAASPSKRKTRKSVSDKKSSPASSTSSK